MYCVGPELNWCRNLLTFIVNYRTAPIIACRIMENFICNCAIMWVLLLCHKTTDVFFRRNSSISGLHNNVFFTPLKPPKEQEQVSSLQSSQLFVLFSFVPFYFFFKLFLASKCCFSLVLIGQTNVLIPIRMVSFHPSKNKIR